MSDPTNQGGTGDFRGGSREEKRQDETVMLSSDSLSDMVSAAKSEGPPAVAPSTDTEARRGGPNMMIIGFGVLMIVVVVIALVWEYVYGG